LTIAKAGCRCHTVDSVEAQNTAISSSLNTIRLHDSISWGHASSIIRGIADINAGPVYAQKSTEALGSALADGTPYFNETLTGTVGHETTEEDGRGALEVEADVVVDELVMELKSLLADALEEVDDDATLVTDTVLDVLGRLLLLMLDMLGLEVANA